MQHFTFGNTGITMSRTGFGALPIQRISFEEAGRILRRAYDGGITHFDTARAYSDSEEKMGQALSDVRNSITISTKTGAKNTKDFWAQLETSLKNLRTDHIDIYQFHCAQKMYRPGEEDGMYDAMLEAKKQGKILHIGITAHSINVAEEAAKSGLYESLQFPFSHLATPREVALVKECEKNGVGFIAMKALSGGLVTDARLPFAYINTFPNVIPIWGIQHMWEIEQILELSENIPAITDEIAAGIERDRRELAGAFCRSCGYCLPCPANIPIPLANRVKQLLTRSPYKPYMNEEVRAGMERVDDCIHCGACASRCPYGLKPFETMPAQLAWFREFYAAHKDD